MLPPFSLVAPLAAADGYGQSAERLAIEASRQGADLAFVSHDWVDDRYTEPELRNLIRGQAEIRYRPLVVVYFLPFAFTRFQSMVTLGMTMFETDSIPPFWVPCCNQTQGLIVPSEFCQRAFQAKVDVPVMVAPLGVDIDFYTSDDRPGYDEPFTFLMAGLLHFRKGVDIAIRAFREEFHDEPVRLILKTRRGFLDTGSESTDDPRIVAIDADYDRAGMRDLYRLSHCFIACSRGEASGLTPREAMACGTPAIVTDWSGLTEIADPAYCYVTGIDGLEPAPMQCTSYGAGVAGQHPIGNFCIPSVTEIRAAMRMAYEDRDTNREMGVRAAAAMKTWSWERCATKWLRAIDGLWTMATERVVA